jgi:hypothetical protein
MEVWVVIVETKGGHVFCAGVFNDFQRAEDLRNSYIEKYGDSNHAWIAALTMNEPILPKGNDNA